MGLLNWILHPGAYFKPTDLNAANVKKLMSQCVTTSADPKAARLGLLFSKMGFSVGDMSSDVIYYLPAQVEKYRKIIHYMLGQLKVVHLQEPEVRLRTGMEKYDGSVWTDNVPDDALNQELITLYYLTVAASMNTNIIKSSEGTYFTELVRDIAPTLSPKDPNFTVWWETHRGAWEK